MEAGRAGARMRCLWRPGGADSRRNLPAAQRGAVQTGYHRYAAHVKVRVTSGGLERRPRSRRPRGCITRRWPAPLPGEGTPLAMIRVAPAGPADVLALTELLEEMDRFYDAAG